jgi:hypothetical protein
MTKDATKRRSQIGRVLQFFRAGHPDEVRAVFHILVEEDLIPQSPKKQRKPRTKQDPSRRLNGAEEIQVREVGA